MISKHFRLFFIAAFLTAAVSGCSPKPHNDGYAPVQFNEKTDSIEDRNAGLTKTPTAEEIFDARLRYELAETEAGARTLADLEKKNKVITAKSDTSAVLDSLLKEKLPAKTAGERSRQLLVEKKFNEAVKEAMLIPQSAERDFLLADIVRIQLGQLFQSSRQAEEHTEILHNVIENTEKISEPQLRAELLDSICTVFFRSGYDTENKTESKALLVLCLKEAAESQRKSGTSVNDFRKASFFCNIARRLMNLGETKAAEEYCGDAQKSAEQMDNPLEASSILLNVADLHLLAGRAEKAAAALKSEKKMKNEQTVSEILAEIPEFETKSRSLMQKREEIKQQRNRLWANLAVLQVWILPLEEVKKTISEIDEGKERDDAVGEVIEMLLLSDTRQDAVKWLNEISDTTLKNKLSEKIKNQTQ